MAGWRVADAKGKDQGKDMNGLFSFFLCLKIDTVRMPRVCVEHTRFIQKNMDRIVAKAEAVRPFELLCIFEKEEIIARGSIWFNATLGRGRKCHER
jgi:hypothetical protein